MDGVMNNTLTKDKFSFIQKLIEKNGFKFTKQRNLVLKQFLLADRHLSVEEIYQRLKRKNIGLATTSSFPMC